LGQAAAEVKKREKLEEAQEYRAAVALYTTAKAAETAAFAKLEADKAAKAEAFATLEASNAAAAVARLKAAKAAM